MHYPTCGSAIWCVVRAPLKLVLVLLGLSALLVAGCASASAVSSPAARGVPSTTPTAVATGTATPGACATLATPPPSDGASGFALPPNTISGFPNGTAGAGFTIECTPGATQASITAFLNTELAQRGWQRWDPQKNDAHGCGTEPNSYWQWFKLDPGGGAGAAVGWDFNGRALPFWMLGACSLAYGA